MPRSARRPSPVSTATSDSDRGDIAADLEKRADALNAESFQTSYVGDAMNDRASSIALL